MLRFVLFIIFACTQTSCFGINSNDLQRFIKEYQAERPNFSKFIYAIERDLDDIAKFYLDYEGIGNSTYDSKATGDKDPIYRQNILITCVRKNKLEMLESVLARYPSLIDSEECWVVWSNYYNQRNLKIKEKRILNIAIEEIQYGLPLVKLLIDFGADINKAEIYCTEPKFDHRPIKVYTRTPLEAAIHAKQNEIAKFLVERGANINGLLPKVIESMDLDLLNFFLIKGSNPNDGMLKAIDLKSKEALILLLNFGAKAFYYLDDAIRAGDQEIIDILMSSIFSEEE